ncbi:MAG: YHS domain-containing (seleno)protein [Cyclobacteriaceae bacterium]
MNTLLIIFIFGLQQPDLNTKDKLAIQGFDPVSYFSNAPREGNAKYQSTFNTAIYYFVNEENQRKFIANPQKYEPQYGGWCAFAMGNDGTKVKIDPETYKIVDGKLYLFYNFLWTNTLPLWNENEVVLRIKADENWQETIKN